MLLTLHVHGELEERLTIAAAEKSLAVEQYALNLLEQHVRQIQPVLTAEERAAKAHEFLESLINENKRAPKEEDGYDLLRALDENRGPGERKLFPPEMKGITW